MKRQLADLSHTIEEGLVTYQGLPAPHICDYLSREASKELYEEGTEFPIGKIEMVSNTGSYIDTPFHRYSVGKDLSEHWNTEAYYSDHPFLTEGAAQYLVDHGAALVGIDSMNIDCTTGKSRPIHSTLLKQEVPIVEHLCNLAQLPNSGFQFYAVPPKIKEMGTFPVRAFAEVNGKYRESRNDPMSYTIHVMNQHEADIIANWHYDGIYSFYDMEADKEDLAEFISAEERRNKYFSVFEHDQLLGFFCFHHTDADTVDIGLGMKPDVTGKGKGLGFIQFGIEFAKDRYCPKTLTLAVAAFNERAIKVYKRAGFTALNTFMQATNGGRFEFLKMKYIIPSTK